MLQSSYNIEESCSTTMSIVLRLRNLALDQCFPTFFKGWKTLAYTENDICITQWGSQKRLSRPEAASLGTLDSQGHNQPHRDGGRSLF